MRLGVRGEIHVHDAPAARASLTPAGSLSAQNPAMTGGRPTRNCSLCGTPNATGTTTCVTCGTLLPPFGLDEPQGWRAALGRDPTSGTRALLSLPFFLVAALAGAILGVLPFVGIFLALSGSVGDAFLTWLVWSLLALGVMVAAGGLGLLIRGREE